LKKRDNYQPPWQKSLRDYEEHRPTLQDVTSKFAAEDASVLEKELRPEIRSDVVGDRANKLQILNPIYVPETQTLKEIAIY